MLWSTEVRTEFYTPQTKKRRVQFWVFFPWGKKHSAWRSPTHLQNSKLGFRIFRRVYPAVSSCCNKITYTYDQSWLHSPCCSWGEFKRKVGTLTVCPLRQLHAEFGWNKLRVWKENKYSAKGEEEKIKVCAQHAADFLTCPRRAWLTHTHVSD